jgi:hypothetical protein
MDPTPPVNSPRPPRSHTQSVQWELNTAAIIALEEYEAKDSKRRLPIVLETFIQATKTPDPLVDLIPNEPVPARALVSLLFNMVKLAQVRGIAAPVKYVGAFHLALYRRRRDSKQDRASSNWLVALSISCHDLFAAQNIPREGRKLHGTNVGQCGRYQVVHVQRWRSLLNSVSGWLSIRSWTGSSNNWYVGPFAGAS